MTTRKVTDNILEVDQTIVPDKFASGDYYCALEDGKRRKITANTENSLEIFPDEQFVKMPLPGGKVEVQAETQPDLIWT